MPLELLVVLAELLADNIVLMQAADRCRSATSTLCSAAACSSSTKCPARSSGLSGDAKDESTSE